jgi:hypothetical protein
VVPQWFNHYVKIRRLQLRIPISSLALLFNLPNPSGLIMALRFNQSLAEKSTRNLLEGKGGRPVSNSDLTAICEPIIWKMRETRTSHNLMGFHGLLQG